MPGKHAPASPRSFYLSVARVAGALVAGIALLVVIVMAATGSSTPKAAGTLRPSASGSAARSEPSSPQAVPSATASASPSARAVPSGLPRAQVTVSVLNGTARGGLAGGVAAQLRADGWKIGFVGNAAPTAHTTIAYVPGALPYAHDLHDAHPELGSIVRAGEPRPNSMLVVTLGRDYPG